MTEKRTSINDLFDLFSDILTPEDILSAKLMSQFSNAIAAERLSLNLSQKDFAEHIGASQSLISRWECGDYNFSFNKVASSLVNCGCKEKDVNNAASFFSISLVFIYTPYNITYM